MHYDPRWIVQCVPKSDTDAVKQHSHSPPSHPHSHPQNHHSHPSLQTSVGFLCNTKRCLHLENNIMKWCLFSLHFCTYNHQQLSELIGDSYCFYVKRMKSQTFSTWLLLINPHIIGIFYHLIIRVGSDGIPDQDLLFAFTKMKRIVYFTYHT